MKTFKLENEPKIESGFKTPEKYFENFSIKMMEQLPANEPKVISLFQRKKNLFLMVAAVLVLALMIPFINNFYTDKQELDSAQLENYITYQSNVNQYDLINGLETSDINNIKISMSIEDKAIEDILSVNSNLENLILE
ncbi:hypothetical protein LNP27_08105 [Flavobacterium galactosidilyticum]|uniref:hypothetical protein n=1 Tax=Flavobacterium galactosidilyticum TaxID=2893886 RepID=UPI001E2EF8A3|nr:hypothetical protein [Flavobacterium sp. F-340]UFH45107.1 hypothetical protein LNP27_08105 [Flavobacterium sp. F-340]